MSRVFRVVHGSLFIYYRLLRSYNSTTNLYARSTLFMTYSGEARFVARHDDYDAYA